MQEIPQSAASTLVHYPADLSGNVSATVKVAASTSMASAVAATVESLSTTTTAAAEVGDTTLAITAGTPVKGRLYAVELSSGVTTVVECAGVESLTITLAQPLTLDVGAGAAFRALAVTYDVDADDTAAIGFGSAVWTVTTANGAQMPVQSGFRVVARASSYSLTWQKLSRLAPELANETPSDDDTGAETVDAAWQRFMVPAFAARGKLLGRIVAQSMLEPAHVAAVDLLLHGGHEMRGEKEEAFFAKVDEATSSRNFWNDDEETLSPPDDVVEPVSVSLTR